MTSGGEVVAAGRARRRHRDRLVEGLTSLFGELDEAALSELVAHVQPVSLARGETLYRQGDPADSMHVVLTGRLQVQVHSEEGGDKVVAHLSPGETVGEMALFTGGGRTASVVAIRDTTVGLLTRKAFDDVMARHPRAVFHVARLIIGRLTETQTRGARRAPLRSIALIPIDHQVDLEEFGRRLQLALLRFGSTGFLDSGTVGSLMGVPHGAAALGTEVGRLLDEWEARHEYVLFQADAAPTEWTRKCVGYADKILLVGEASSPPGPSALEVELFRDPRTDGLTQKELVLLHPDRTRAPSGTSDHLAARQVQRHHHVPWRGNDGFNRLARRLSNNAVTVVLGGGGARGFAHVGAVRAIREVGIPIDAAGGTSFGALIAATVAFGYSDARVLDECKSAFADDRPLDDYTLPIVSLIKGHKLVSVLKKYFGETTIDDMWMPYFAVSSSLSMNRVVVHTHGELWRALRASVSLPGIFPPHIENGELLVDGGLLNNLPVDVMKEVVGGRTIAIDVSVASEYRMSREAMPSAYEYVKARLFKGHGATLDVPTLNRVVVKATTLGSSHRAQAVRAGADLYLNPPVRDFDLLGWNRFHEIVEAGYTYTRQKLREWLATHSGLVQRDEVFDSRLRRDDD